MFQFLNLTRMLFKKRPILEPFHSLCGLGAKTYGFARAGQVLYTNFFESQKFTAEKELQTLFNTQTVVLRRKI